MKKQAKLGDIQDMLHTHQEGYKETSLQLHQEAQLARAEASSARLLLEGKLAAYSATLLPDMTAPLIAEIDQQFAAGKPGPGSLRDALLHKREEAREVQARIDAAYGGPEGLREHQHALQAQLAADASACSKARKELAESGLELFHHTNHALERDGYAPLTAARLNQYERPATWRSHAWRWLTEGDYRTVRPMLASYAARGVNLPAAVTRADQLRETRDGLTLQITATEAEQARTAATQQQYAAALQAQPTDHTILLQMRAHLSENMLEDAALFTRITTLHSTAEVPELKALHTRMSLFEGVARQLDPQRSSLDKSVRAIDKALTDVQRGMRRKGSYHSVSFDLDGKSALLGRQQRLAAERVRAARDIREASHSSAATSSSDSNMLLWYMLMSDSSSANSGPRHAFSSGQGGEFGGGGASSNWDGPDNTAFRAELLGQKAEHMPSLGLSPDALKLDDGLVSDLGLESAGLGGFNQISSGLELGNISADLSEMERSLGSMASDLSSVSSSYDGGGYSCGGDSGGGGGDCGGGGGD